MRTAIMLAGILIATSIVSSFEAAYKISITEPRSFAPALSVVVILFAILDSADFLKEK